MTSTNCDIDYKNSFQQAKATANEIIFYFQILRTGDLSIYAQYGWKKTDRN